MLERSPGAVGCGHCHELHDKLVPCPVCGRPVCPECASPAACPEPTARSLRLGLGWRLRAVDDEGQLGVATSWTGMTRCVLELSSRRVVSELTGRFSNLCARLGPGSQLTYAGRDLDNKTGNTFVVTTAVRLAHLGRRITIDGENWLRDLSVSEDGTHAALAVNTQMHCAVHVVDLKKQLIRSIDQPEQAQATAASGALDLLAVGSWSKVQFYRLRGSDYLGTLQVGAGDVAWLAFGRRDLALATTEGELRLLAVDPRDPPEQWEEVYRCEVAVDSPLSLAFGDRPHHRRIRAAVSPDGSLIAVRSKRKGLVVIRPADGARQDLTGHTDRINLVRFVRGGQLLVSADLDNRVILWPRLQSRGDEPLVAGKILPIDRTKSVDQNL